MSDNGKLRFLINFFYIAAVTTAAFLTIRYALIWFWPFFGGLALAYLFRHLARSFRSRSPLVVMTAGIAFYCAVVLVFWIIFAFIAAKAAQLLDFLPNRLENELLPALTSVVNSAAKKLWRFLPDSLISPEQTAELFTAAVMQFSREMSSRLLTLLSGFIGSMPLFLVGFTFMILSSFAIAMDYNRVTQFLMRQLPHSLRPLLLNIKNFLISCLFRLMRAYILLALITFAELSLGFWALGVKRFWQIAAITALFDMLPLFGLGAVLIPWGIFSLLCGNTAFGTAILLLFAVATVVRSITEPRVVGDSLDLHPAASLALMYFGLRAFGFVGMIAAPIAALLIRYLNENGKLPLYKTSD